MMAHDTDPALPILVVEDDMMIAIMLEDQLTALGYKVVGPAARVDRALALIDKQPLAAALLDVNVGGEKVDRVADKLHLQRIPFAFVSGYAASWMPRAHADRPRLEKPFQAKDLKRVLENVLNEPAR